MRSKASKYPVHARTIAHRARVHAHMHEVHTLRSHPSACPHKPFTPKYTRPPASRASAHAAPSLHARTSPQVSRSIAQSGTHTHPRTHAVRVQLTCMLTHVLPPGEGSTQQQQQQQQSPPSCSWQASLRSSSPTCSARKPSPSPTPPCPGQTSPSCGTKRPSSAPRAAHKRQARAQSGAGFGTRSSSSGSSSATACPGGQQPLPPQQPQEGPVDKVHLGPGTGSGKASTAGATVLDAAGQCQAQPALGLRVAPSAPGTAAAKETALQAAPAPAPLSPPAAQQGWEQQGGAEDGGHSPKAGCASPQSEVSVGARPLAAAVLRAWLLLQTCYAVPRVWPAPKAWPVQCMAWVEGVACAKGEVCAVYGLG